LSCTKWIKLPALWCSMECKKAFYKKEYGGSCLMEECEREIQEERAKCKEYFEKVLKERLMNGEKFTDILRGL